MEALSYLISRDDFNWSHLFGSAEFTGTVSLIEVKEEVPSIWIGNTSEDWIILLLTGSFNWKFFTSKGFPSL